VLVESVSIEALRTNGFIPIPATELDSLQNYVERIRIPTDHKHYKKPDETILKLIVTKLT